MHRRTVGDTLIDKVSNSCLSQLNRRASKHSWSHRGVFKFSAGARLNSFVRVLTTACRGAVLSAALESLSACSSSVLLPTGLYVAIMKVGVAIHQKTHRISTSVFARPTHRCSHLIKADAVNPPVDVARHFFRFAA